MLTSLGAERQRRATGYDKVTRRCLSKAESHFIVFIQEFTMEDLGVSIGLSYHDRSRKVRGGKVHFDTPKARRLTSDNLTER